MTVFRDMTPDDRELILNMAEDFYRTDAVEHPVARTVLLRTFQAAVDPEEPLLRGVVLLREAEVAGFLYYTQCFAAEMGGVCVILEELYLLPAFRGMGLGEEAMAWLESACPHARRFRLEVTGANHRAKRLYEGRGYRPLGYEQMVKDRL